MTNNSPCGCGDDHEEEKDAPAETEHECCGGGCHDHGDETEHECCSGEHSHEQTEISTEELENLKKAILEAGYKIEETADGELKILE